MYRGINKKTQTKTKLTFNFESRVADTMDILEKIRNNTEVLESIFKHLNLSDQIKVLQCSQQFETPIVQYIWRGNYKNLRLHANNYKAIAVESLRTGQKCTVSEEEFEIFVNLIAVYLKSLKIFALPKAKLQRIFHSCPDLMSVSFNCLQVNNDILQQLAQHCGKLESLTLDACTTADDSPQLPKNFDISIIAEMNSLKHFHFSMDGVFGYFRAMKMCQELNVKSLSICATIRYHLPEIGSLCLGKDQIFSVKNLKIGAFADRDCLTHFHRSSLAHFKNLTALHFIQDEHRDLPITINFMAALANQCPQLVELTLEHCKLTKHVYTVLPQLTRLSLKHCERLSKANLRGFLNIPQLKIFTIWNTECLEDMSGFAYVTPTCGLQTLILETSKSSVLDSVFKNSQNRFKTVTTLKWFHEDSNYARSTATAFESVSQMFPNLQELVLERQYLTLDDLRHLKSLKVLKFDYFDGMDWPYLEILLQPLFLTQLFIGVTKKICCVIQKLTLARHKSSFSPMAARETLTGDLEFLKIPLIVFRVDVDFWLKFLQQNTKLELKIFTYYGVELLRTKFLQRLLRNKLFPAELRYINICDLKIDCRTLKSNTMATLDKYCFQKDDQEEYYIILHSTKGKEQRERINCNSKSLHT